MNIKHDLNVVNKNKFFINCLYRIKTKWNKLKHNKSKEEHICNDKCEKPFNPWKDRHIMAYPPTNKPNDELCPQAVDNWNYKREFYYDFIKRGYAVYDISL